VIAISENATTQPSISNTARPVNGWLVRVRAEFTSEQTLRLDRKGYAGNAELSGTAGRSRPAGGAQHSRPGAAGALDGRMAGSEGSVFRARVVLLKHATMLHLLH